MICYIEVPFKGVKFRFYQVFSRVHVKFRFYQVLSGIHVKFKLYQVFSAVHVAQSSLFCVVFCRLLFVLVRFVLLNLYFSV